VILSCSCATGPEEYELPSDIPQDFYRSITGCGDPYAGCVVSSVGKIFVVNLLGGDMSVIDMSSYTLVKEIELEGDFSYGIFFDSEANSVYATCGRYLSFVDPSSCELTRSIDLGETLYDVAANSNCIFVSVRWEDCVYVVDKSNYQVTDTIAVSSGPKGLAISPTGDRLYVANSEGKSLSVIDTATNLVVALIPLDGAPHRLCFSPDGSSVYVTCGSTLQQVNTSQFEVDRKITVDGGSGGLCTVDDGKFVYVACPGEGQVSVVSTTSWVVAGHISCPDGFRMYRMVFANPNGSEVYATTENYPYAIDVFN